MAWPVVGAVALLASVLALPLKAPTPLPPLCSNVTESPPPVFINCALDTGTGSPPEGPTPETLHILEYNIDRNARGGDGSREQGLGKIIELLSGNLSGAAVPGADVIVLSEVARGCANWEGVDISGAKAIAEAFGMSWAYGVEYVSFDQTKAGVECTIGNAILSRFPLANVRQLRFKHQCCRYSGRAGGRMSLVGDILVSSGVTVRVSSAHLESGTSAPLDVAHAVVVRAQQADELAKLMLHDPPRHVVLAGDLNSPLMEADPTIVTLELQGLHDAHRGLKARVRKTVTDGAPPLLANDDYILTQNKTQVTHAALCEQPSCRGWSDHIPIWVSLAVN